MIQFISSLFHLFNHGGSDVDVPIVWKRFESGGQSSRGMRIALQHCYSGVKARHHRGKSSVTSNDNGELGVLRASIIAQSMPSLARVRVAPYGGPFFCSYRFFSDPSSHPTASASRCLSSVAGLYFHRISSFSEARHYRVKSLSNLTMTAPQLIDESGRGNRQTSEPVVNGRSSIKRQAETFVPLVGYAGMPLPAVKAPGTILTSIQPEDNKTADAWIPRDPKMIRLTGRHPFNSEPPPTELLASYITSPELHYVRNHGAVPKVRHFFPGIA